MRKILETSRLLLREMTQGDYRELASIIQDDQTMYAYAGAFNDEETQAWLDKQLMRYRDDGFGLWAVILKSNGKMIGQAGISRQEVEGQLVSEIGYLFNRLYWHNGYATEAAMACKDYAFNTLGFNEVFSIVRSANIPSKDVAISNGMIIRKRIIRSFRGIDMPHFVLSATNPPRLQRMEDFFDIQAPSYDEYMLDNVAGLADGYAELVKHIPNGIETLLDLGCGTGLELEKIFRVFPNVYVTGIDLSQTMLDKLSDKYTDKKIKLICASYLNYDFGSEQYDCVISFETLHHFTHEQKTELYRYLIKALKPGGRYVEGDYMVETQEREDELFAQKEDYYTAQNIKGSELYHFDTPCTIGNQIKMLLSAGFATAEKVWRSGNTTIIVGQK